MHLGNGAITPECAVVATGAAALGLGLAFRSARREATGVNLATAGWMTAAVLAAQMVNVPVSSISSAHLVGGVLLAVILGPGIGALAMAAVLAAQALLLGDGGLAALGANVVNMALVPAGLVALARGRLSHQWSTHRGILSAGLLAALAVVLSAGLVVAETALFRPAGGLAGWSTFAGQMALTHLPLCLIEGLATGALVYFLVRAGAKVGVERVHATRYAWAATTIVLLAFVSPLASRLPDGYEAAAQRSGLSALLADDLAGAGAAGPLHAAAHQLQNTANEFAQSWLGESVLLILIAAAAAGLIAFVAARLVNSRTVRPALA